MSQQHQSGPTALAERARVGYELPRGEGGQLYRNANDPSEMIGVFEWSDLDKARQFAQSDNLRETMQRVGVSDIPDIYFVEKVEDLAR